MGCKVNFFLLGYRNIYSNYRIIVADNEEVPISKDDGNTNHSETGKLQLQESDTGEDECAKHSGSTSDVDLNEETNKDDSLHQNQMDDNDVYWAYMDSLWNTSSDSDKLEDLP